jgi:glutathione S-transferase
VQKLEMVYPEKPLLPSDPKLQEEAWSLSELAADVSNAGYRLGPENL